MNKFYTPEEYKNMPQEQLITLFRTLIKKLGESFGERRFSEDVEQDVTIELLKRQQEFKPERNTNFPAYAQIYMKAAAKKSRQINVSDIYVVYGTMVNYQKRGKAPLNTMEDINDHLELADERTNEIKESELFSVLKIILRNIKGNPKEAKYKEYVRGLLNDGKSRGFLNKKLREILKDTILNR